MHKPRFVVGIAVAAMTIAVLVPTATYTYEQELTQSTKSIRVAAFPVPEGDTLPPYLEVSQTIVSSAYQGEMPETNQVLGDTTIPAEFTLSPEQVSDVATPAVVRVFNYIKGTITVPDFDINFTTFDITPVGNPYTEPIEAGATGTGFFVNDDGYILTNAHVASPNLAIEDFTNKAADYYGALILRAFLTMNDQQLAQLEQQLKAKYGSDEETAGELFAQDLEKKIKTFIADNAKLDVVQQVSILDQATKGTTIKSKEDLISLVNKGFKADIVGIEDNYDDTHKDVALLKIDQTPTPSLSLNTTDSINVGQNVYVLGFPSNASANASDLFSTTLTQGSIGAVKEIDGAQVYQTDAKISEGSSGGPLLDQKGNVIGIMTYLSEGEVGDTFAFAIPIKTGLDLMNEKNISGEGATYAKNYIGGLVLAKGQMCRRANESFAQAQKANTSFNVNGQLQKYIDKCDEMIAAGNSLDSFWDKTRHIAKGIPIYAWAGGIALLGSIIGLVFFLRRYRHTSMPTIGSAGPTPVVSI